MVISAVVGSTLRAAKMAKRATQVVGLIAVSDASNRIEFQNQTQKIVPREFHSC